MVIFAISVFCSSVVLHDTGMPFSRCSIRCRHANRSSLRFVLSIVDRFWILLRTVFGRKLLSYLFVSHPRSVVYLSTCHIHDRFDVKFSIRPF